MWITARDSWDHDFLSLEPFDQAILVVTGQEHLARNRTRQANLVFSSVWSMAPRSLDVRIGGIVVYSS